MRKTNENKQSQQNKNCGNSNKESGTKNCGKSTKNSK